MSEQEFLEKDYYRLFKENNELKSENARLIKELEKWGKLAKISIDPDKWLEMYSSYSDMLTKEDVAGWYAEQFNICCKDRENIKQALSKSEGELKNQSYLLSKMTTGISILKTMMGKAKMDKGVEVCETLIQQYHQFKQSQDGRQSKV